MPIETDTLEPEVFGAIEDRVMDLLGDGRGYYKDEILKVVKCSEGYLRTILAKLQRRGHIFSKTLPEESQKQSREPNSKVYFIPSSRLASQ